MSRPARTERRDGTGSPFFPLVPPNVTDSGVPVVLPAPTTLHLGCAADGYLSDQTRTVVVDRDPPEGFVDVHEAVLEASEATVGAVEPEVRADPVDAAARAVVEDAGDDDFPRLTGHDAGLDIHEPPFLVGGSYLEGWNRVELEPGTAFSVEPAVYTDRFGVRVEDLVVVTDDGGEAAGTAEHGAERRNDSRRAWEPLS